MPTRTTVAKGGAPNETWGKRGSKRRLRDVAFSRTDGYRVDPEHIVFADETPDPDEQTPEYQAGFEALVQSIAEIGVVEPIAVELQRGTVVCVHGRKRVLAVRECLRRGMTVPPILAFHDQTMRLSLGRTEAMLARHQMVPMSVGKVERLVLELLAYGRAVDQVVRATGVAKAVVVRVREQVEPRGKGGKAVEIDRKLLDAFDRALATIEQARSMDDVRALTSRARAQLTKA